MKKYIQNRVPSFNNDILNNLIIYLPIFFEKISKNDKLIFKYLYWANNNLNKIFFSQAHIAEKCKVSKKTVQRFYKKYNGILIKINYRNKNTPIIKIPDEVVHYIKKYGGIKIVENFKRHKSRLINMGLKDPYSQEFTKSFKQVMNKKDKKMSTLNEQKCPPNYYKEFNTYTEEYVLYESSDSKSNEEVLLRFGFNNQQIIRIKETFGTKYVKKAIEDSEWYTKIGKKIYNPYGFVTSRAKNHMLLDWK